MATANEGPGTLWGRFARGLLGVVCACGVATCGFADSTWLAKACTWVLK